jgi:hypothetical protein
MIRVSLKRLRLPNVLWVSKGRAIKVSLFIRRWFMQEVMHDTRTNTAIYGPIELAI